MPRHGPCGVRQERCGQRQVDEARASHVHRFEQRLLPEPSRHVFRDGTRRPTELFGSRTLSESTGSEPAVMPAEIEQLPDLQGYLKCASQPAWRRVRLDAVTAWHGRAREAVPSATRGMALEHE